MLLLYKQAVIENLINNVENYHLNYKIDICDSSDENIKNKIVDGTLLPTITVTITQHQLSDDISNYSSSQISQLYEFSVVDSNGNHSVKKYNYINSIPMWLSFHFTVLAKDISQIVDLEKFISETYNTNREVNLQNPENTNEVIPFEISIDNEAEIERTQNDKFSIFQSIITLKCSTYIPSISSSYHPAQIQFDKKLQMSKLEDLQSLCSLYNVFSSTSDIVTDKENNLKNINFAQENICSTFNIPLSYSQDRKAIQEIYKIMEDENCDIKVAIEKFKQQLKEHKEADKKEAERISRIEEKFSGTGDKALNHYTDAIIEDLKKRLSTDYLISIFGGSSFMEYFIQREKNTLAYPNILIYTESDFSFSYKNYNNKDANGNLIIHNYTVDALPIEYGIKIEVYAKDEEIKKDIENQILQIYTNEFQLQITDSKFQNEIHSLSLSINPDKILRMREEYDNKDYYIYKTFITFNKCQSVYYQTEYSLPDVSNNQRLQARLFQLAEFYYMCEYNIRTLAIHHLKLEYKSLFHKTKNSRKGSLLNMALGKLDNICSGVVSFINGSDEYNDLRNSIQRGEPFNKKTFDTALKLITNVYPNLYDKTMQGWTIEQIQQDLNKYADLFNRKWNQICNLLAVSCISMFTQLGMSGDNNKLSEDIHSGLSFYSKKMLDKPGLNIQDCKSLYDKVLLAQKQRAEGAFDAARDYLRESNRSDSSGGILGNITSSKQKNEKPDLMGSANCMYRKKDSSGFTVYCDYRCPLYWECKRGAGS